MEELVGSIASGRAFQNRVFNVLPSDRTVPAPLLAKTLSREGVGRDEGEAGAKVVPERRPE